MRQILSTVEETNPNYIFEITLDRLLIWALRACVAHRDCQGLQDLLHAWFGSRTHELLQNAQILVWANQMGGHFDYKFKPFSTEIYRKEEALLLEIIYNFKACTLVSLKSKVDLIAGSMADFAIHAIDNIAQIICDIEYYEKDEKLK